MRRAPRGVTTAGGRSPTSAALENLARRLDETDPAAAEALRRYGIAPGGHDSGALVGISASKEHAAVVPQSLAFTVPSRRWCVPARGA